MAALRFDSLPDDDDFERSDFHSDWVLASVDDYWSARAVVQRLLARWDGPATCGALFEAYEQMVVFPTNINAFAKTLERLVKLGAIARTRIDRASIVHHVTDAAQFEYRLIAVSPKPRRAHVCGRCGAGGHNARSCLKAAA